MAGPVVSEEILLAVSIRLRKLIKERNTLLIDVILNYPEQFNDREYVRKMILEEGAEFINEAFELWELLEIIAPYLPINISEDVLIYLYKKGEKLTAQENEELGKEIKYQHFENIVRIVDEINTEDDWKQFWELLKTNRKKQEERRKKH